MGGHPFRGRLAALFVGLSLVFPLLSSGCSEGPSVDALVANYRANQSQFSALAELASIDATFGIEVDEYGGIGRGIETSRIAEYSGPLTAIGATHVSISDHAIDVTTGSEGLAVSGASWGYFYTLDPDVDTVSIDTARSKDAPQSWLYPLGDGWYASVYRF